MMNIRVYGVQADELPFYEAARTKYNFAFTFGPEKLSLETVHLTRGFEALIIMTSDKITPELAAALQKNGVRFLGTRSAGTDHIDVAAVRTNGLRVANVPFYSPNAIAEHTILLALNVLRHSKREERMTARGDFSMAGLKGRELGQMTAGVFGTGRIGIETIKLLHGFGCRVLACNPHHYAAAEPYCEYREEDMLFREADILFLHCPLEADNRHMINRETIGRMKDGAYLINTARGGLVDHPAVLDALKSGKLAGFGFDVYEGEAAFLRKNIGMDAVGNPVFRELLENENTCYTAHVAFYTYTAIESMIRVTLDNLKEFEQTGECRNEVFKA